MEQTDTFDDLTTRILKVDRATLSYLELLLQEVAEFEKRLEIDSDSQETRHEFQKLITLTIGSSENWRRLVAFAGKTMVSVSTAKRYLLHHSAPYKFQPFVTELCDVLHEEYARVEEIVIADEKKEAEEKAKADKEWQKLVERIFNDQPETFYNSQVRYRTTPINADKNEFPLEFCFSYPCRGIYDFNDHFPHVCHVCANEGKEPEHGRAFLNGEDGLLLLPHIIYSQADVKQLVTDLENAQDLYYSLHESETIEEWIEGLQELVETDPFFATLPPGDPAQVQSHDLNEEKTVWVW